MCQPDGVSGRDDDDFLERVWEDREERVYREVFGDLGRGIYPIPRADFERLGVTPDPRWLFVGAFECPPTTNRPSWLYVSSGLSNPWEQGTAAPSDFAGLGVEFVLESPTQSLWAARCVHWLAALQLCARGDRALDYGHRLNLHRPIDGLASALSLVLIAYPTEPLPQQLSTLGGDVDLLYCIGITESEREFARRNGNEALVAELAKHPGYPVTDPNRRSVV